MNQQKAFLKLKDSIESSKKAYKWVINNPTKYRIEILQNLKEAILSIECGQSLISIGEINRQFYNATHRLIDNEIIELPGADFCSELGQISHNIIIELRKSDDIIEEMITSITDCEETVDISYI